MENNLSDTEMYETSTTEFAPKPQLQTPMCCSINQMKILQSLRIEHSQLILKLAQFFQNNIQQIRKEDSTKINRLPAPW